MAAPLKILMVSYTSFIQKFYQTLPHEIALQSGANVQVLVPPHWKELWSSGKLLLEHRQDPRFTLHVGQIWFTGSLHFAVFRNRLVHLLKTFQPDIIDLEDEPFNLGSLQMVLFRQRYSPKSKLVLHASQHQFKHYPPPFNWVEKYVLQRADAILVRNAMARDVLQRKGYCNTLKVITHGVDTEAFQPKSASDLRQSISPQGQLIVGFVGSLVEQKGVKYLVEALSGLPATLLLVGDGDERENLRQLADVHNINIYFAPPTGHEAIIRYMNAMDIFVLPSLTRPNWVEKFGRVLIEAMACGVPLIGSSSGEIPNVIGDAGLVFKEADSEDLHKKLTLLLENPDLRRSLGQKGRQRTLEKFSWKAVASQTLAVYDHLLSGNHHD